MSKIISDKIAIAISIYKSVKPKDLEVCLESIVNQTKKGDIFVKVDGEISTNLKEIFSEYKDEIEYIDYRDTNRGIARSYNELFEVILKRDYEYIARMDADDIAVIDRIQMQYDFMQLNREIDVVGGYIEEFGDDFEYSKVVKYPLSHQQMYAFFSKRVPIANVTTLFRRSFFEKAGLYPVTSATNEDTLMWLEGFKNGCKFANIPEVLVKVRVSRSFWTRRGGIQKAYSDLKDRFRVIRQLGYNNSSYFYAIGLFAVNISPGFIKKILYERLR